MARTLYEDVRIAQSLAPSARTNGTANGTNLSVDPNNADQVVAYVQVNTWTDGSHVFKLQNTTDDGAGSPVGGSWADVPAAYLIGSAPTVGAAGGPHYFGSFVQPGRPHFRVVQTTTGATTGAVIGAWLIAGNGDSPAR